MTFTEILTSLVLISAPLTAVSVPHLYVGQKQMKAVAFDLGDTLVEYEGIPLSWEAYYRDALENLAAFLQITPDFHCLEEACAVLRRYNTRLNPRTDEFPFSTILDEILRLFRFSANVEELACAKAFFQIFRQRLRAFPEVPVALATLRQQKIGIGVFTDVPYGMPRELVDEDIHETSLTEYIDTLVTSRCAGFRKPSPKTLEILAKKLSCDSSEMLYIGNEKKDIEVAREFGCHSILLDRAGRGIDWGQDRTIAALSEI